MGGLGNGHILGWEVGVFAENAHIFVQLWQPVGIVQHDFCGRQKVDALQGLAAVFPDFNADLCTSWHGDVTVLKRQVGQTLGKGTKAAFHDDFLSEGIAIVVAFNSDFVEGIMQGKPRGRAAFDAEALWRVGAEMIGLLCVQETIGKDDGKKQIESFHGIKCLIHAAKVRFKLK